MLQEQKLLSPELPASPCDVLILPMTEDLGPAIAIATAFRSEGLRTQLYTEPRKFKAKMSYADRISAPWVVLLGEDELAEGTLSLKNMMTGEQQKLAADEAARLIRQTVEAGKAVAPIKG